MPCESTIENIATHILEHVVQDKTEETQVLAYEGISKGAIVP